MPEIKRIAMWSGPRNISTAMMRSWENRPDTCVVDEPLYAHYLASTRIPHPGSAEILASQDTDWRQVVQALLDEAPATNCQVYYQKHMSHHQLPEMELDWILKLNNCFLIRDPDAVVASYAEKRPDLTPEDLGFSQQEQIYRYLIEHADQAPPIIDSEAFLKDPRTHLNILCDTLALEFYEEMLEWPVGPRASDGVWAKYWYHNVEQSSGFAPWRKRTLQLNKEQKRISDACRPAYEFLKEHAINIH